MIRRVVHGGFSENSYFGRKIKFSCPKKCFEFLGQNRFFKVISGHSCGIFEKPPCKYSIDGSDKGNDLFSGFVVVKLASFEFDVEIGRISSLSGKKIFELPLFSV